MAYIAKLNLKNFRNYQNLELDFCSGINFFYGDNGQGKTNILEAINFLSLLKSFRTNKIKELFLLGEKELFVGAVIKEKKQDTVLKVHLSEEKIFFCNSYRVKKAIDFINNFQVISFLPEDINIIKGSSSYRRLVLNMEVSKIFSKYLGHLKNYNKLLKVRHKIFRQFQSFESLDKNLVNSFEDNLIFHNQQISLYRKNWIKLFDCQLKQVSKSFFGDDKTLQLIYKPNINLEIDDSFLQKSKDIFCNNLAKDYQFKVTHNGSHRDDFELLFKGKNLRHYGSQGQCRLASIAFKLAVAETLINLKKNKRIIFLIDDVLGELDQKIRGVFFETMKKTQQTFITSTDKELLGNFTKIKFFHIEDAQVKV